MEQVTILAKNESGGNPYNVSFVRDGGKLKVTCNCPEGRKGELCHHKVQLASYDIIALENPSQRGRLFDAHIWVVQSGVSDPLLKLIQLMGEEERDSEAIVQLEREVAHLMKEGS